MKRINQLIKIVKDLTDYELKFTFDDDTHIDHDDEIIYVNCHNDVNMVFNHIANCHHRYEFTEYEPIVMVVLHEVGHYMIFDDLTDTDFEEYALINLGLDLIFDDNNKYGFNAEELNRPYFDTTIEWNVTEWALDYIKDHKKELKDWKISLDR